MKRILRKVASLCVAAAMVAAFGVTALATDLPTAGTVGDNNPAEPLETTLVIQKELITTQVGNMLNIWDTKKLITENGIIRMNYSMTAIQELRHIFLRMNGIMNLLVGMELQMK